MRQKRLIISFFLFIFCLSTRDILEASLVGHVLVQLPLLTLTGALLVGTMTPAKGGWNQGGFTALFIALTGIIFWMLPRSIDAALTSPIMELAKFISVPLLIGAPLKLAWNDAHPLLRGFLKAQAISMLAIAAFIYTHAPVRLCNSYLVNEQEYLGYGFLLISISLAIYWTIPLFKSQNQSEEMAKLC